MRKHGLLLLFLLCFHELCNVVVGDFRSHNSQLLPHLVSYQQGSTLMEEKSNVDNSPNAAPQPFIPLLAPSPRAPFTNNTVPSLSGLCTLNFSAAETMMSTTAVDCWAFFAPFLANVICCPQLHATLAVLIGQSSKDTGTLALDVGQAKHCLSDIQKILAGQGANERLQKICSIHPMNLTEGSCPVKDVNELESVVDSSKILAACEKVDPVNECCSQICQNAIFETAREIALKDGGLSGMSGVRVMSGYSSRLDDCKSIVLRWLAGKLDPLSAKQVLRRISNCNLNKACPLVFPDTRIVAKYCRNGVHNKTICCYAMENYIAHLQKQSFITNLQALDCAASLGSQLQAVNITENVYSLCHIGLKDFSLQVGSQESGCLLPSLPSDATFDRDSGISFTCDLNDNIAAPWPSTLQQVSVSSCNKTIKLPALPAMTPSMSEQNIKAMRLPMFLAPVMVTTMLL